MFIQPKSRNEPSQGPQGGQGGIMQQHHQLLHHQQHPTRQEQAHSRVQAGAVAGGGGIT